MSKCATCDGTGKAACVSCHGEGIITRTGDDGESVSRLCGLCQGKRVVTCGACHGTGQVVGHEAPAPGPAAVAARPQLAGQAQADRLAGRWDGAQGTWYEFVPDGNRYRATGGGPRGVSAIGTATLVGHTVKLDADDPFYGHYSLELTLRGTHLDGIDRKAGFPLPVTFHRH